MMNTKERTYSEMKKFDTLKSRFNYLKLGGRVSDPTFGYDRWLNQQLYQSPKWRSLRHKVIARDVGRDLGIKGYTINDKIIVHHINPITPEDIRNDDPKIYDMENLVCVSEKTHLAIHYGDEHLLPQDPLERRPGDTTPWKGGTL